MCRVDARAGWCGLGLVAVTLSALVSCASPTAPSSGPAVFVGAGDIADCTPGAALTAALLDEIPGTVFAAGDLAYPTGRAVDFRDCYDPTWGRHKSRTRPAIGNHDAQGVTPSGLAYFDYFNAFPGQAGPRDGGYYSFRLGDWTIIALNSETDVRAGSPQAAWLRAELATRSSSRLSPPKAAPCTLAFWHRPLFASGQNGNAPEMRDLWTILADAGADLVVTAHDHLYQRFAPQTADGVADPVRGLRSFVVGTGGAPLRDATRTQANTEVVLSRVWGVLKLTLSDGRYDWEFISVTREVLDAGSGTCR
jgi:acid phosphatase type 7